MLSGGAFVEMLSNTDHKKFSGMRAVALTAIGCE